MNLFNKASRKAFTMLELIFVIAILGIVSSIGAEIIAKTYSSYIAQRAIHRSSLKTELIATQIVNRLAYAIPHATIIRKPDGTKSSLESFVGDDWTILQWIGYDADSFGANNADRKPGWNGFADLNASTVTSISTPGSNLDLSSTIMSSLGGSMATAAIFFPDEVGFNSIGYDGDPITGLTQIASATGETIGFVTGVDLTGKTIREQYKVAWTSYAIVPVKKDGVTPCANTDFPCDLALRYDFRPWEGESYAADAKQEILATNVSVFRFTGSGNTIRFKICQEENIGEDFNISTCKEKAVIR